MTTSKHCLDVFKCNPKEFRHCWWIHDYTPETKEQSKQWTKFDEFTPKKVKMVPLAGKIMATVFWDSRGIIFTDYLEKRRTITRQYYANLLDWFDAELKKKRPHLAKKKCSFTIITQHHLIRPQSPWQNWSNYELLFHSPYSPDLAPCDFYLFPNM